MINHTENQQIYYLKILKLNDIRSLETLKIVFKFKLGLLPQIFNNFFNENTLNTLQAGLLKVPKYRTNYRSFSTKIQGPKLYNKFSTTHNKTFNSVKSFVKYYQYNCIHDY